MKQKEFLRGIVGGILLVVVGFFYLFLGGERKETPAEYRARRRKYKR